MTNGEKIQTILDIDKDCTEVYGKNGMMTFSVPQDWWNAEYKESVVRDNGVKNELNRVKDELGVASELEKNSKKLEKDFGESDCISREDALDCVNWGYSFSDIYKKINELPSVTPQEPKTGHCNDCKWWKDSDGVYRRGVGAESKCPINNVSVNHGFGYCYMFEPQESEET